MVRRNLLLAIAALSYIAVLYTCLAWWLGLPEILVEKREWLFGATGSIALMAWTALEGIYFVNSHKVQRCGGCGYPLACPECGKDQRRAPK